MRATSNDHDSLLSDHHASADSPHSLDAGTLCDETRDFYRWFEQQWLADGLEEGQAPAASRLEESPPTRFMLDEVDERGKRIRKLGAEVEQLREQLLEREIQIVHLESEAAAREHQIENLARDIDAMAARHRRTLDNAGAGRSLEQVLHTQEGSRLRDELTARGHDFASEAALSRSVLAEMAGLQSRIIEIEERAAAIERARRAEGDRFRELFAERDNRLSTLKRHLHDKDIEIMRLHAEHRRGGWLSRLFRF